MIQLKEPGDAAESVSDTEEGDTNTVNLQRTEMDLEWRIRKSKRVRFWGAALTTLLHC